MLTKDSPASAIANQIMFEVDLFVDTEVSEPNQVTKHPYIIANGYYETSHNIMFVIEIISDDQIRIKGTGIPDNGHVFKAKDSVVSFLEGCLLKTGHIKTWVMSSN